jgi:hypothetical protein
VKKTRVYPQQRRSGRFFGRRVDCENVPLLPASAVSRVLCDPRDLAYFLLWERKWGSGIQQVAQLKRCILSPEDANRCSLQGISSQGWVEVKRHDGTKSVIRTTFQRLPRNGGKSLLLLCPDCGKPKRALYGWQPGGQYVHCTVPTTWGCRKCKGLRFQSEGGARVLRRRGALRAVALAIGRKSRSNPWYPLVFSSPMDAVAAGLVPCKRQQDI